MQEKIAVKITGREKVSTYFFLSPFSSPFSSDLFVKSEEKGEENSLTLHFKEGIYKCELT